MIPTTLLAALDASDAIAEKATKAPWTARLNRDSNTLPPQLDAPHENGMASMPPVVTMMWMCHESGKDAEDRMVRQTEDDALFIEHARTALPLRNRQLRAVLPFVQHLPGCAVLSNERDGYQYSCSCGLTAALREAGIEQ